jgi:hypothetical protein
MLFGLTAIPTPTMMRVSIAHLVDGDMEIDLCRQSRALSFHCLPHEIPVDSFEVVPYLFPMTKIARPTIRIAR